MADWTDIADSALDPDAPLTSDLAYAWRDNPIAIAEGASGATKVQGVAFGTVFLDAFSVASTTAEEYTTLTRVKTVMIQLVAETSTGTSIRVAFTNNAGGSWGSNQTVVLALNTSEFLEGVLIMDLETGAYSFRGSYDISGAATPGIRTDSGTLTVPSNCNGFRISGSSASMVTLAGHVFIIGGVA